MHFEILGDIFEIETFATGTRIRFVSSLDYDGYTDAPAGGNGRESHAFD